jgi:alanyl-tRNA synthetase
MAEKKQQPQQSEDVEEKEVFVKALTSKEIKKLARPEFQQNPDKFYPTGTLKKLGYSRTQCPTCQNFFWRKNPKKQTCGDSQCEGRYSFIGRGTGIGRKGKKITYSEAWEGFKRSLSSARVPCTPIARYPVVARWRADVEFVAAGIFCFQPYCVTGELEPPANPLIQPQFCLRFNDLDNIGLTGRHYSGFVMLGIQVFNKPDKKKFWSDECVEFNYRWLTEELGIDPEEITFIEDVWAGGGNLGPSIEYFVSGLELGNMVFMQFKTYPDGRREELDVQVIDVGIGLERVPWLINGTATSYVEVFPTGLKFLTERLGVPINNEVWDRFGPLSCLLNVDEVADLDKTWELIAKEVGKPVAQVKQAIESVKDLYVILDHTRTVLMAIEDGSLPSNVGGASNIRNVLRRVFALLAKKDWWAKLGGVDGLLELFECQRQDMAKLYGPFKEYKSFGPIIRLEFERYATTDDQQKKKLDALVKKLKGKPLSMDDWITCVTSWGISADTVAKLTGLEVPGTLYAEIAERQERMVKALPAVLYSTANMPPTNSLYYGDHHMYDFKAKIADIMQNVERNGEPSIVVLDQSAFYPTSGGQEHDTGSLDIDGKTYEVVDVLKVGPVVLHVISPPLPVTPDTFHTLKGKQVTGHINAERREQLRNHHTATHIVFAACRRVLGPHVWQHGAKKTVNSAHLDITHYKSLTHEEVLAIENEANRIVHRCKDISKGFMPKDEAEKKYGFHLYQGGVVPGNELRVVNIADTDTEACCGTHCDNTAEVGTIKIQRTSRISDGILRLYYVAGENALKVRNAETTILHKLTDEWGIPQTEILPTAERFFNGYTKFGSRVERQTHKIIELQVKCLLLTPNVKLGVVRTDEDNAKNFISLVPNYAKQLQEAGKGIVFVGQSFVYGLFGRADLYNVNGELKKLVETLGETEEEKMKAAADPKNAEAAAAAPKDKGPKKPQFLVKDKCNNVANVAELRVFALGQPDKVVEFLLKEGFAKLD